LEDFRSQFSKLGFNITSVKSEAVDLTALAKCETVKEFSILARKLMGKDPQNIFTIIRMARENLNKAADFKQLDRALIIVREKLKTVNFELPDDPKRRDRFFSEFTKLIS